MGKLTNPFLLSWIEVIFVTEPKSMSWRQERKRNELMYMYTSEREASLINLLAVIGGSYSD